VLADERAYAAKYGAAAGAHGANASEECEREVEQERHTERAKETDAQPPGGQAKPECDWRQWTQALTLESANTATAQGVEVRACGSSLCVSDGRCIVCAFQLPLP
jgi:hypothetical protein